MKHDISLIRPEMRANEFRLRGQGQPEMELKSIKKGLQTLHTLETMAVSIYKDQITKKPTELNRQLIVAMCNEMTHLQDFQVKLYEYGFKPGRSRWIYLIIGVTFGFFSRLRGEEAILKTGIWVEKKAVRHYQELLHSIPWDDEMKKIIEKNHEDEKGHIARWRNLLEKMKT